MHRLLSNIANKLSAFPWMDAIIVLIGAVMINEFFQYLALGYFTPSGFSQKIISITQQNNAPHWWNLGLVWFAQYSHFFAPFSAVIMALIGIFATLLLARGATALLAFIFFFVVWISQLAVPGVWIFEFLFPASFALCVALARITHPFVGLKFFGSLPMYGRVLLVPLVSIGLWYAMIISHNGGSHYTSIAWQSALVFGLLLMISTVLDYFRKKEHVKQDYFSHIPWFDIMTLIIAAMLVIQIYADIAVGWYTTEGYAKLIHTYAVSSGSPEWIKAILAWISQHANIFLPLQVIFEVTAAILLSLLILRAPMLLLTAGFFAVLMFSEFGVSAHWPAGPEDSRTWTWELMFVTLVAFMLGLAKLAEFINARSIKEAIFGSSFYSSLTLIWRILIAALGGSLLWCAGMATHVFGKEYTSISLYAGVSFFFLLLLLTAIERFRVLSRH